jgi:hypothetical protein
MSTTRKGLPNHPNLRAAGAAAARLPKPESFKRQTSRRMRREWWEGLRHGHPAGRRWTDEELARVRTDTDQAIARDLGRTPAGVQKVRLRLGIPSFLKKTR